MTSSSVNIFCIIGPLWGITGGFQRPVMWRFDVFFDLCLNKWLSKQLRCQWCETPSRLLWHECKGIKHLQMHFHELKLWYVDAYVTEILFIRTSVLPNDSLLVGGSNGLVPNRQQPITFTIDDLIHWYKYALPGQKYVNCCCVLVYLIAMLCFLQKIADILPQADSHNQITDSLTWFGPLNEFLRVSCRAITNAREPG